VQDFAEKMIPDLYPRSGENSCCSWNENSIQSTHLLDLSSLVSERSSAMAIDIARAWKDPEYRKTLTPEELASIPPNPAGPAELTNEQLEQVTGGSVQGIKCAATNACTGANCAKNF
jgi:mersacidin/lichenicidin family type 2 lantibiotic